MSWAWEEVGSVCEGQSPSTVGAALAAVRSGLAFLNQVAVVELPGAVQADCLRELARGWSRRIRRRMPGCWLGSLPVGRAKMMGSGLSGRG